MPNGPSLKDVDLYLKARAMSERAGTAEEGATWRKRVEDYVHEHPDLPAVAVRVEAAMRGEEPAITGDFAEWLRQQSPAAGPSKGSAWFDRLARGLGAGAVAATRALDEEAADGVPLRVGQVDVRIARLASRDEIVIRLRVRARGARKLRDEIARRVATELDAFLAG